MARIGDLFSNDPNRSLPSGTGPAPTRSPEGRVEFARQMQASQQAYQASSYEEMLESVDHQGKLLLRFPTPGQVAAYRDAIRRYLKQVNDQVGRVDKRTDRRNRTLIILRELDDKLGTLTDAILGSQSAAIDLAATINEIRGLLLDLLI